MKMETSAFSFVPFLLWSCCFWWVLAVSYQRSASSWEQPSSSMVPCLFGEHPAILLSTSSFISFLTWALSLLFISWLNHLGLRCQNCSNFLGCGCSRTEFFLATTSPSFSLFVFFGCLTFWGVAFLLCKQGCWSYIVLYPWLLYLIGIFWAQSTPEASPIFQFFWKLARILLVISLCVSLVLLTIEHKHLLWVGLSLWVRKFFALSISCIACQVFNVASVGFRTSIRRMPSNPQALILHFNIVWRTMSSVYGAHQDISSLAHSVISSE